MRIRLESNTRNYEYKMQAVFENWLQQNDLSYAREFSVKEVNRIADFLFVKPGNGLINVEAKSNPSSILFDQTMDHAKYCDYCFFLLSNICVIPRWMILRMGDCGIGLITYNYETHEITESLPAFKQWKIDKSLNRKINELIISQKAQLNIYD